MCHLVWAGDMVHYVFSRNWDKLNLQISLDPSMAEMAVCWAGFVLHAAEKRGGLGISYISLILRGDLCQLQCGLEQP